MATHMNNLLKTLSLAFWLSFPFITQAQAAVNTPNSGLNTSLSFQVIQSQLFFDKTTVEAATLSPPQDNSGSYGVNIKLKAAAAKQLEKLSQAGLGKTANIIFNKQVISSPTIRSKLSGEFLIVGFTKDQAEQFIKSLHS